jgi:uncharacterized protein YabE (DUF348 family)/3D (Asp-Asp-Asp) domain-containing protein
LLLRDVVGGHPRKGSEETRRQAAKQLSFSDAWTRRWTAARPLASVRPAAAARRRYRLQAAGLLALLFVVAVAVILPARTVHIAVDGQTQSVASRSVSDASIAAQAGIDLRPGDAVRDAGGGQLTVDRATEAELNVDGRTVLLRTQADTISEMLAQAGVPFSPADSVLREGVFVSSESGVRPDPSLASLLGGGASSASAALQNAPVQLEVRRAVPFTLVENGQQLQLRSSRETVATALRDVGVRLGPGDEVQPPLDTELTSGTTVHVDHAMQLVVTLPEGKAILYSLADTVGEAVAQSGIDLPADYRLEPAAATSVSAGLAVHVVGISSEQVLETERIESRTIYEADPSLPFGQRRVVQGQDGVYYRQYSVVYENGEVASRELSAEWYDPEPADTIIYYSPAESAPANVALDVPDGMNVVSALRVYATWYNPRSAGRSPSDPSYGITATGVPVDRGVIAVDPSVIPLGTRLYIPGYGYGVAADTGGGIRGNMIDLGYPDGVSVNWNSRWVEIYILGP